MHLFLNIYLSQPSSQIERALPVGQVMDQDDPMHSVEEHMPCVPLAVASPHIPQLYKELPLLLSSLQIMVQLHLYRATHCPTWRRKGCSLC